MITYLYRVSVDPQGGFCASRCNPGNDESKVKVRRFATQATAAAWVARDKVQLESIAQAAGRPSPRLLDF